MAFWDRWLSRKESAVASLHILNPGQPVWSPKDYKAFAEEGYMRNVVAYQAINRVAEAVSSVRWMAWRGKAELTESPLLDLIAKPNPQQGQAEYIQAKIGFLLISGNEYEERVTVRNEPREIYTLRPDRMKIIPPSNGGEMTFRYSVGNGKYRDFVADPITGKGDLHHTRLFNPLNDWYGMSPIEAGAYSVDQHNESMSLMQALLQNSARPSGALVSETPLSDDNYNRLKAQMEDQYQGAKNAGRPMLLEGGVSWQAMGMSPKDMEILETKYSAARDVSLAFGVPAQLMGIPGDNTYSNYQEARLAFWEDTVIPLVERVADNWTNSLGEAFGGLEVKPDYDHVPAIAEKKRVLWDMADKSMDLTINERRLIKGYEPLPDGDVLPTKPAAPVAPEPALSKSDLTALAYGLDLK
jgi:HK97 family phage portal protein